jgi:lipoprotein signal peptidase
MTRVALQVFGAAFIADLLSKRWAVSNADHVVFNTKPSELPLRIAISLLTIAVAGVMVWLAAWRGLGRQWGLAVGTALLVAGILANGVSPFLWERGVPDFIAVSGWVWNVADFEIAIGLTGGILSVAMSALLVYGREASTRRRLQRGAL